MEGAEYINSISIILLRFLNKAHNIARVLIKYIETNH